MSFEKFREHLKNMAAEFPEVSEGMLKLTEDLHEAEYENLMKRSLVFTDTLERVDKIVEENLTDSVVIALMGHIFGDASTCDCDSHQDDEHAF